MVDDILINKAASIERCIARVREEYAAAGSNFATDFTRQDAAILNIQRACEQALDMGQHIIRQDRLGIAQQSRDIFTILAQARRIDASLAERLIRMTGFRNIAVHQYQELQLPILVAIIEQHLDDFLEYSRTLLQAHP